MLEYWELLKVGTVSVDGTHLRANASKNRNVTYDRAGESIEELKQEVSAWLEQAEAVDRQDEGDGQRLPEDLARREVLQAKKEKVRGEWELVALADNTKRLWNLKMAEA